MNKKGLTMLIFLMLLLLIHSLPHVNLSHAPLIHSLLPLALLIHRTYLIIFWGFNSFFLYCLCLCLFLSNLSQGAIGQPKQTTSLCDLLPTKILEVGDTNFITLYFLLFLLFVQNVFFTVCKLFMFLFCINV
jgi:hypothetical protein